MVVPAAALVAYSLAYEHSEDQSTLYMWVMILWVAPWASQPASDYLRVQILTVVLAAFGYWALTLAGRGAQRTTPSAVGV